MKALVLAGALCSALLIAPAAQAGERFNNGLMGAAAGALVGGPVGAIAGGAIGYTSGRQIARGMGIHRHHRHDRGHRHYRAYHRHYR